MQNISIAALLVMLMTLTGCEFIEGIFNLGVAVGIFLVIVVVGLIIWIFSRIG
ncbi:MAG: hypothetical protein H0V01_15440 [Bacteroidetes bacterium]|nr:hypothetical protein [Bacteroidota bacterium]HET6243941.1 hypothetical protein [Bacteroidia bacterium]